MRGRKPGSSGKRLALVMSVLSRHPEGLWIRGIAKEAGLNPNTVLRYVEGPLASIVEITTLGEKPFLKVVRLKPAVQQKLEEGMTLDQIIRVMNLLEKTTK